MRIVRGAGGIGTDYFLVALANGQAYGGGASVAGVAGQYSQFIVYNPAASGKTLRVRHVIASASAANTIVLAEISVDPGLSAANLQPLKVGGAPGVGKYESGNTVGVPSGLTFMSFDVPALQATLFTPGWVCELPANTGIAIYANTLNILLRCSVAWIEV